MRKIVFLVVVAAVAVGIALTVLLLTRNPGVHLRFVYTGRTRGYLKRIEEKHGGRWLGGFARRGTVIKQAASPTTFVVDAGGFVARPELGTTAYRKVLSKYVLKGMEMSGVEVANVGIIDQALGRERLTKYVSQVSFPFVSASLTDPKTDEYVFKPFVVIKKGGVRVAFVGILDTELVTTPDKLVSIDQWQKPEDLPIVYNDMVVQGKGFNVLPIADALTRVAPLLEGKADVVVVLANGWTNIWTALAPYSDGKLINVALGVGTVSVNNVAMQGHVPLAAIAGRGVCVGILDVQYRGRGDVRFKHWDPVVLTTDIKKDPQLATVIVDMRKALADVDPLLLVKKIYKPYNEAHYVGAATCAKCHKEEYDIWAKGPHAHAFNSLVKIDAQFDPQCLKCHSSDYWAIDGFVSKKATPTMAPVTCEVCHGRGSLHVQLQGKGDQARLKLPLPPRCVICHTEGVDPDYHKKRHFKYNDFWARIQHGKGRKPETAPPATKQNKGR